MDTIKFANGAVYDCSFLATIPEGGAHKAFIALSGVSFSEAAAIFSNPEMTRTMEWGPYRLVDYTELQSVNVQPYGIQAVISGGRDELK